MFQSLGGLSMGRIVGGLKVQEQESTYPAQAASRVQEAWCGLVSGPTVRFCLRTRRVLAPSSSELLCEYHLGTQMISQGDGTPQTPSEHSASALCRWGVDEGMGMGMIIVPIDNINQLPNGYQATV